MKSADMDKSESSSGTRAMDKKLSILYCFYNKHLASWYRKGDWKQRFSRDTCVNLGDAYHSRHEFQEAMKFFQWGLGIAIETRNKDLEGAAKMNIGVVYRSLGDIKKAIEFFEHGLSIAKEVRNKPLEGYVYRNLGFAYQDLGLFQTAIEYLQKNLRITKMTGNRPSEGYANVNLGAL